MFDCDIKTDMQGKAIQLLCKCADMAEAKGLKVPDYCSVDFSLDSIRIAGRAGQGGVHKDCNVPFQITLHGKALEFYKHEFYDTIVHEFCHILQFVNYPNETKAAFGAKRVMHGSTFYYIANLLGLERGRCHSYDLAKVTGKKRRTQRRWDYKCGCGASFKIATVTHNKMQKKGQRRHCKSCNTDLVWTGKEIK